MLKDLDKAKFVTMSDVDQHLLSLPQPTAGISTIDLSGVSTQVGLLETDMFKPEGLVPLLQKRVKYLEDWCANNAVERRNKILKDQQAVDTFVLTSGDSNIMMLAQDPFFTLSEGMASKAAAIKANYNSLLEARIALLYQITYPENIMERSDKKEAAPTDG